MAEAHATPPLLLHTATATSTATYLLPWSRESGLFFYVFIVFMYLRRPAVNDVVAVYPVDARWIFYGWLLLSIFVLDWAKSAIAGFKA